MEVNPVKPESDRACADPDFQIDDNPFPVAATLTPTPSTTPAQSLDPEMSEKRRGKQVGFPAT